jgi:acyl-CoA synthetase (AMP-forming)/AMP-acid ligase II
MEDKDTSIANGEEVAALVGPYNRFSDFLPNTNQVALWDPTSTRANLTFNTLHSFITTEFDLCQYGLPHGARVGLLLPNGPELAVCLMCVLDSWCAAPMNPTNTAEELLSECKSCKVRAVIVSNVSKEVGLEISSKHSVGVILLTANPKTVGIFTLELLAPVPLEAANDTYTIAKTVEGFNSYSNPQTVLLLHTSGTSGNKKLVPYSCDMIIIGIGSIIISWRLTPDDVCLNMMPLFHIGGIVRNVLSPLLAGGSSILCPSFDPTAFWEVLTIHRVTWYYASPTMHQAILQDGNHRALPLPVDSMRFIANAAGGLLPSLAQALSKSCHYCTAYSQIIASVV